MAEGTAAFGPGPTIEQTARFLGGHRWAERRCYSVVGAAVPTVADPAVKRFLAEAAAHHAWRADQLGERLPRAGHVAAETVTVAPEGTLGSLLAVLDGVPADELLARVYVELAAVLLDGYRAQLDRSSPVADAAVMRTLRMVIDDLERDRLAAAALLAR